LLNEPQILALKSKKYDDEFGGEIETTHPGYLGAQDTFYLVTLKGVGRIYQQTFVDTYSKAAFVKLYTTKTAAPAENSDPYVSGVSGNEIFSSSQNFSGKVRGPSDFGQTPAGAATTKTSYCSTSA
jgi:hypothetical protein